MKNWVENANPANSSGMSSWPQFLNQKRVNANAIRTVCKVLSVQARAAWNCASVCTLSSNTAFRCVFLRGPLVQGALCVAILPWIMTYRKHLMSIIGFFHLSVLRPVWCSAIFFACCAWSHPNAARDLYTKFC